MRTLLTPAILAALAAVFFAPAENDLPPHSPGTTAPAKGPSRNAIPAHLEEILHDAGFRALSPRWRRELIRYARACFGDEPPPARCWAPDTPVEIVRCFHAVEEAARGQDPDGEGEPPQEATQLASRWSWTATNGPNQDDQGLPVTLTWGIAPDGTTINGSASIGEPTAPSDLIARLAVIYAAEGANTTDPPDQQPWFSIFQDVFANISAQTGVDYVYEPNDDGATFSSANRGVLGVRPDVRIGGHEIDGNSSTLAYNFFPSYSEMIIDTTDDWLTNTSNNSRRLRNLVEHEHCHGLGLRHVCPADNTKIMEPFVSTNFLGIQFDDLYGIQHHYGDRFEKVDPSRNNDSFATATPIIVSPGVPFSEAWLSIDHKSDEDYFSFTAVPDSLITIRAIPSLHAYQEGAEASSGTPCPNSSYPLFDSSDIHDLRIDLYGPGHDLLVTADATSAGQGEEIYSFATSANGLHYARISGGNSSMAQLYQLEVIVDTPSVALDLVANTLAAESFAGQNGQPDPGETVQFDLTVSSIGGIDATNVQGTLTGPASFTPFTAGQDFGDLPSGSSATLPFTFALDGACGETITLDLTLTADGGYQRVIPVTYPMGSRTVFIQENVDTLGMPAGWTSLISGLASSWQPDFEASSSPDFSFFAPSVSGIGEANLLTPPITLGATGNILSFQHYYELPFTFDGGVLEISIAGGPWQDVIAAGGSFVKGGYNARIRTGFGNPLEGRLGWTGDSGGFFPTTIDLPPAAAGREVQFRWRLGHDFIGSDIGWFVDDIVIASVVCDDRGPVLTISASDPSASEFHPGDLGAFIISAPLPVLDPIPITLNNTGTAGFGSDVAAIGNLVLASGQSTLTVAVQALTDSLVEGPEVLDLTIEEGGGRAVITIADSPYGQWAFSQIGLGAAKGGPFDDFDGDRGLNIEEYAWQTNPSDPADFPSAPTTSVSGGFFEISAPDPVPADLDLIGEASGDLVDWSDFGVLAGPGAFRVPIGDSARFLRLNYQLLPSSP